MNIDKFYRPDNKNFHDNACVGNNGGAKDYSDYARGYWDAAICIYENRGSAPIDITIYPLAFCFRHSAELFLKHFAVAFPLYLGKQAKNSFSHKLQDIWSLAWATIKDEKEFLDILDDEHQCLDKVKKSIKEIDRIDYNGEVLGIQRIGKIKDI